MPTGTFENLGRSGFVRTPPTWATRIVNNLLRFGASATVFDPTAGEGDLLAPAARIPGAQLFGVEISQERLAVAQRRLPGATFAHSAIEAVRVTPGSMTLILSNPPYMFDDGQRAEYRIISEVGASLRPGGILVAILPARSAWNGRMIRHWCKHYQQVNCWKFPHGDADDEGAFERYTQIVVVGVRRATPLSAPETAEETRLSGWRWRQPKKAESPWAQGTPPPDLPDLPIPDPYLVPAAGVLPELTQLRADEATLLCALAASGVQRTPTWADATTWQAEQLADQPVMPPTGEAHLAAEILTGLLDGEVLTGPDGGRYVFVTCVTQTWRPIQLDPEELEKEHQKGSLSVQVQQQEDDPLLGVLNLDTGEVRYYQGEEVFAFLTPWLSHLATRVLEKRVPLYRLQPAAWELEVCARIGLDKQLSGSPYPGLVPPQLHRVFAMGTALDLRGRVAIQGEPGTGKTRQSVALMARQAHQWKGYQKQSCPGQRHPAWLAALRVAWKRNPRACALLGPTRTVPAALPVLVTTPKRVITTWQSEIKAAWPEAEVIVIEHYTEVDRWMQRCVESKAPAVIGILPHSQSRAFGRQWVPAVREKQVTKDVPELHPSEDLLESLEPVLDRHVLVAYRSKTTGAVLTRKESTSFFYCPDCGARVEAEPYGLHKERSDGTLSLTSEEGEVAAKEEDDEVEPVTERVWFETKPRWCRHCHGALWTETRVPAAARKASQLPFATWAAGAEQTARTSKQPGRVIPLFEGIQIRAGGKLGKASRTARAAIKREVGRLTDAAGSHGAVAPESWSPFEFLQRFYAGCVALTIVDESHNARSRTTDIAHSVHLAGMASQTLVYASGTHYGGCLDDLYHYWFRFNPRFWQRFGLGWNDVEQAIPRFGVIQQWTREHESTARRGSGQTDVTVTTIPAPGISARLLPFLLSDLVFLSVLDVGAYMPPRTELPEIVAMVDPLVEERRAEAKASYGAVREAATAARRQYQTLRVSEAPVDVDDLAAVRADVEEAEEQERSAKAHLEEVERWAIRRDLATHHDHLTAHLRDLATNGNPAAALAQGTVPRWWAALPCVEPSFTVIQTKRGKWGEELKKEELLRTELLTADYSYPLERRLKEIVTGELAEGHTCMLYVEQNGVRSMAERLAKVLSEYQPWALPNSVEAEDREAAIRAAVARGHKLVIVNYRRVAEGLNLQDCIDAILWVEMALNLFHLDQASRRAWRLGREREVRIYYLAYSGSAAHRKLCKLASESGAAAAFAGEPAKGALVEHVGAHKTMLARLASGLEALGMEESPAEALDDQQALQAAFARRAEELAARLKQGRQWFGLADPLPALLEAFHTRRQAEKRVQVVEVPRQPQVVVPAARVATAASVLRRPERQGAEPLQAGKPSQVGLWDMAVPTGATAVPERPQTRRTAQPHTRQPIPLFPDLADTCAVCGAEVEVYGPKGQPFCQIHAPQRPAQADPGVPSAGHGAPGQPAPLRAPASQALPAPQPAPARPSPRQAPPPQMGTVRVHERFLAIQFVGYRAEWVAQARKLNQQYRGRGYVRYAPTAQGWLLPLSAAAAARAAFPDLAGWGRVDQALNPASPEIQGAPHPIQAASVQPAAADPLVKALEEVKRLYRLVFNREPQEAVLAQHVRSEADAQHWLKQLRLHQQQKQRAS